MHKSILPFLLLLLLTACVNQNGMSSRDQSSGTPVADYEILFIGNSHSKYNHLPQLLSTLISTGTTGKTAQASAAKGWSFLAERIKDSSTQATLEGRAWTHVILQAQKYSSTGKYHYPTDAAQEWIRRVRAQSAQPILFPEWPRRHNKEEGERIYQLHRYIAWKESACVAPIGPVWDEFLRRYPEIRLHRRDGNHSNLKGALLTAFVFYETITGRPASQLPHVAEIDISSKTQKQQRELVSRILESRVPCAL